MEIETSIKIDPNNTISEIKAAYQTGFERGYKKSIEDNEVNDLSIGFVVGLFVAFILTILILF